MVRNLESVLNCYIWYETCRVTIALAYGMKLGDWSILFLWWVIKRMSQNSEGYIIVCLILYGILKVHEKVIYGMKLYEWQKMLHMVRKYKKDQNWFKQDAVCLACGHPFGWVMMEMEEMMMIERNKGTLTLDGVSNTVRNFVSYILSLTFHRMVQWSPSSLICLFI